MVRQCEKASHVPRLLLCDNWEGGSRLLLSKKWLNFPATIFSNTSNRSGVIEIALYSPKSEEEDSFATSTTSVNLQHADYYPSLTTCLKITVNLGVSFRGTECGCWKRSLHCLALKCAKNKADVSTADQTSLPPLSGKGGKLELAPKIAILTVDHHFRGFGAFVKRGNCIFIDQLSMTTNHQILLPISLRRTTTAYSICSLLHNVS